jgi:hypothetical protein
MVTEHGNGLREEVIGKAEHGMVTEHGMTDYYCSLNK